MIKPTIVELDTLRNRLREAEETLAAIRHGEVDSLIVSGPAGDRIFSLKGAEQPYRMLVEQMSEGAITTTCDGTILYANRRFAALMRMPLQHVIGTSFRSFILPQDTDLIAGILHAPGGKKTLLRLKAADESLVSVHLSCSQLPIDEQVNGVCMIVTDMTEHDANRELTIAMEQLRLTQQMLEQQNSELARAREESDSANAAKDNFLAALSHELRTPLTPVLMAVESMETSPGLSAELRRDLELVHRNVAMEARLIDDLLDITRIVRGKIEMNALPLNLHSVLADALEVCQPDITTRRHQLVLHLEARNPHLLGDSVRVQQVLWNLIRNAIKFTAERGQITIRSFDQNGMIHISVTDTGIGIDPRAMIKIFNPFEQTDRVITRRFGGLGLGLAISRRLAEMHNGTITVHSEGPGRGATFTLILPAIAAPNGRSNTEPPAGSISSTPQLRILLVEDHDDTRASLTRLLRRRHLVQDVQSIGSALDAASAAPFDLVISDLGLPDGSGLELMRQLRAQYQLKGICLSGYGMEEDVSQSKEAGFAHHLTKPIDFDRLESTIELISRRITGSGA